MVITNDDRMKKMMTMQLEEQWGLLRMVMKQWERWHKDEKDSKKQWKWQLGDNESQWGMVRNSRTTWGVGLGRKKMFLSSNNGGWWVVEKPIGERCLDAKKNAKGHRGIELKRQKIKFERWTMEVVK
jgi:hypothetical protein